jgi:transcriptional regulator with XRE-family HTH domain
MPQGPTHRLAREIRAARAYANMSRIQVGAGVSLSGDTIGRYERGKFDLPLRKPMLDAIAKVTGIPQAYLDAGFLAPDDPATRFADAARREARRRGEHPESELGGHVDEDAEDAES